MNPEHINIDQGRQGYVVTPTQDPVTGEYGEHVVAGNGILEDPNKFQEYQANNDTIDPQAFEPQESIDDQLVDAFTEANPDTQAAIAYVSQFWSEQEKAEWDSRVDNADWFDLAQDLEQILQQYRTDGSPDVDIYEEPEITQQQVDAEYQDLLESEPEGIELASEQLNEAEQYYQQGDQLAAQIMMASSQFHSGAMSADQAIESVLNSGFDQDTIIQKYYELFN